MHFLRGKLPTKIMAVLSNILEKIRHLWKW